MTERPAGFEEHLWLCSHCRKVYTRAELLVDGSRYMKRPPCHLSDGEGSPPNGPCGGCTVQCFTNEEELKERWAQSWRAAQFQVWLERQGIVIPDEVDIFWEQREFSRNRR